MLDIHDVEYTWRFDVAILGMVVSFAATGGKGNPRNSPTGESNPCLQKKKMLAFTAILARRQSACIDGTGHSLDWIGIPLGLQAPWRYVSI